MGYVATMCFFSYIFFLYFKNSQMNTTNTIKPLLYTRSNTHEIGWELLMSACVCWTLFLKNKFIIAQERFHKRTTPIIVVTFSGKSYLHSFSSIVSTGVSPAKERILI